jgi:hypothetical protein
LLDFKVAKWAKYKLLNLCSNQLTSTQAAFAFVPPVFRENIPTMQLKMISAETACWERK